MDIPNKPLSIFFRYKAMVYYDLKAKHSELTNKQLLKLISKEYQNLPTKQKDKLTQDYQKDLDLYRKALQEWKKQNPDGRKSIGRSRQKQKYQRGKRVRKSETSQTRQRSKSKQGKNDKSKSHKKGKK